MFHKIKIMENQKSARKIAMITTSLFTAALIFAGWVININSNLKSDLNQEKLKQDSLLSTKLLLDKEIIGLHTDIGALKGTNAKLDLVLNDVKGQLELKQNLVKKLSRENNSLKAMRAELSTIKVMRDRLATQVEEMKSSNSRLSQENISLKDKIRSLEDALLDANTIKPSGILDAGNFRVEFQKRNPEKLTVKSKKTKTIQITMNLAKNGGPDQQNIYVKILDPKGMVVSPNITPVVIKEEKITFSIMQKVNFDGPTKKAVINIKPNSKMKARGIYKILVYNERDGLIGSTEVKTN